MQTIELQAKTLDDAKKLAAEQLGVSATDLQVTVLEEIKGLFGKSQVRIRAEVAQTPAKKAPAKKATKAEPEEKPAARGRGAKKSEEPIVNAVVEEAPKAESKPRRGAKPAAAKVEAPVAENGDEEGEPREEIVATAADGEQVAAILAEILELADLEASIEVSGLNGRYVNVELDGRDVAYLVGKHGEVLNSFQYLVNVILNKKLESGVRVTLDGNHYRTRREEALTKLATQIADQVKERGEEAVLDALPAFERRIVHKALSEIGGISTYSEGEEPNRRVVIAPA